MAEYKRNHTIPEFMIRFWASMPSADYWATRSGVPPYEGVWSYEIAKKTEAFVGGDFKFAVRNDVYVPKLDAERATGVERWLGDLENALASLVRKIHERNERLEIKSHGDAVRALMAMFSLECRSEYNVAAIVAALEANPSLVEVVGGEPGQSLKQVALQNLIHTVTERASSYGRLLLRFWFAKGGGVLLSDRPTFSSQELPTFIALTNRVIVSVEHGPADSAFKYEYRDLEADFLHTLNGQIALQARAWLVHRSRNRINAMTVELIHHEPTRIDQADGKEAS